MDNEGNKSSIFTILIVLIITGAICYIIYDNFFDKKQTGPSEYTPDYNDVNSYKKYGVNEYNKLYVNEEQMARIYLTDYQNIIISNSEEAFALVAPEYANINCKSLAEFNYIVNNRNIKTAKMKKYSVKNDGVFKYYIVEFEDGNSIVFKTEGVMNYTVYLDNETVVINK